MISSSYSSVLTDGAYFSGTALDPLRGEIFVTGLFGIYCAQMDGSGFTIIVSGYKAAGIQVNSGSNQLYWADNRDNRIVSSSRHGTSIDTPIVQLGAGGSPWGLTTYNGSMYWGNLGSRTLQRNSPIGKDVVTVYNGTSPIQHLTVVSSPDLYQFQVRNFGKNPCDGQANVNGGGQNCDH